MGPASNWQIARPDFRTHLFLSPTLSTPAARDYSPPSAEAAVAHISLES
jgi:hypothetical protein